jgi:hypothetical protein
LPFAFLLLPYEDHEEGKGQKEKGKSKENFHIGEFSSLLLLRLFAFRLFTFAL